MSDKAHDAHDAAHGHSPFIQHHFDDAQHQFDAGKLGIWLFLAQEVLFFSALFVAYILYRIHHPEIYSYAHKYLDVKYGAINTAVLIFSSLTAAWAVRCAQLGQRAGLILCIAVTIVCAFGFLTIKYIEYNHKVHEHLLFGNYFDPCVTSSGAALPTRTVTCPGQRSSVVWNWGTKTPTSGCYDAIDQDPHEPGVQADCKVTEITVEEVEKGKEKELSSHPIPNQCPEEHVTDHGPKVEPKYPCWRPAYQPAVCKKGVGIVVEYGDHVEREDVRIKAECKPSPKPVDAGDILANPGGTRLELGKKAIQPQHELTPEEEHELEASGPPPEHTNMFFTIYFAMTGLHGIHVLFGIGVFIWLLIRAIKGQFTPEYFGPVDYAALYWHIVDLIWIFLFPLLYLIH